ncbi:hypothetical protein BD309DRAFT_116585 [Dichomitus squalens]|uniref:Uncharacterized protein n=1 Tax=Dichomitus squalens TaxID=114155 RepID=A0A4Q9Q7G9_9APHY|nr:hypothetical protein BD309DRAFT_116585 [Dichomitus squalens]TBU63355.1 hypothetical protein BD310DRAFT_629076 [Dichomitus squalens]
MTSSIAARRPPPSFTPTQPPDEGYLNRSLLDNIDAQGDAEPVSSSDSEAAGASATTFGSLSTASSLGSPSIPFHLNMQSQLVPPRSDSPNHHALGPLKSSQHSTDFLQNNNTTHAMYNNITSIGLPASEFPLSSTEPDALNYTSKADGSFAAAPFRTSTAFSPFHRPRHPNPSFRDTSSAFPNSTYPSSNDLFGASQNPISRLPASQPQSALPHPLDSLQHTGRSFDFAPGPPQFNGSVSANGASHNKQLYALDAFRQGLDSTPTLLPKQPGAASGGQSLLQNSQHPHQQAFQAPYMNGLGGHSLVPGHHAQPQFGAHLSASGAGPGQGGAPGNGVTGAPNMNQTNGPAPSSQAQEEISTIFVVGFPDDMSEREFQNMFTFSVGFEAATLKIPNKESTSYGNANAQGARPGGLPMTFGGSNDPYNIVTMNQGGVLIDGGRDGPMTSWPSSAPNDEGHFMQNNVPMQPPRKQIIGFAKFRTRAEALEARDVLQGRRVDVEKGAVLKAEMAKKNLHTKRGPGVGPLGLPPFPGSATGTGAPDSMSGHPGLPAAGEALTQRDKQLGALGAMGIDLSGFPQRRDRLFDGRDEEDRDRRRGDFATIGIGAFGTRGPRERAEEDERERERRRKEEVARMRQNSFAFEAFHSVPQQMVRQGANSLLSAENGIVPNGLNLPSSPPALQSIPSQSEGMSGPWGNLRDVGASAALRKMGVPQHHMSGLPPRPQSPSATSPPTFEAITNGSVGSQNGHSAPGSRGTQFSPDSTPSSLPSHPSLPSRPPRAQSPSSEPQSYSQSSQPNSKPPSVSGSQSGHEDELVRSVGALAVSTESGSTSPQLPSPASGTSSGGGRNGSDQNPPINTLYVGNLPTSTSPGGHTLSFLEDRLRELFLKQAGYRKLCFRQKSNGPMCFVEFESVEFATKALNDLYGDTLNGLVRNGGIRLSYSKNPLGVRTPNSGGNGPSLQQQQQQYQSREMQDGSRDAFSGDPYPRHSESTDTIRGVRRDTSSMTSPASSYRYTTSPPPPRFFSPPLPSGTFSGSLATSTSFPRANPQGFGFSSGNTTFSPFGIPHSSIPDQPVADASNDHLAHPLTPAAANIEASRAG